VLKELGPKLGLPIRDPSNGATPHPQQGAKDDLDPSRSAAVAMAGLAGHNVDENALYGGNGHQWAMPSGFSPEGMVHDLTSLFEAAGGLQMMGQGDLNGGQGQGADALYSTEGAHPFVDEGLSNILKELF